MTLRRMPGGVNLTLEVKEPQAQAVMCRPAGAEVGQVDKRIQVFSGSQGAAAAGSHVQAVRANVAQEARRSQFGSGRQGTSGAGNHGQSGSGRRRAGIQKQSSRLRQAEKGKNRLS